MKVLLRFNSFEKFLAKFFIILSKFPNSLTLPLLFVQFLHQTKNDIVNLELSWCVNLNLQTSFAKCRLADFMYFAGNVPFDLRRFKPPTGFLCKLPKW